MKQNQLIKNASYASVATGLIIFVIKFFGWIKSDSVSLFASLIDSLLDITSSFLNMVAVHIALAPADDNHRFGHNKVQDLAIFAQAIFFISSGAFTLFVSSKRLWTHNYMTDHEVGVHTMLICTILTIFLLIYQTHVIRKTNSQIIKADKIHYLSDLASNVAVVISILVSKYFSLIDAIFGILIALYIIFSAINLFRNSLRNLLDEEFSKEDKEKILSILRLNKDILGVHDLKTRKAGDKAFIQFHIDLDPTISLISAHNISEKITQELVAIFIDCEVIIHQDPIGYDDDVQYREKI
jgi:cation diffusion facilitator family transporter